MRMKGRANGGRDGTMGLRVCVCVWACVGRGEGEGMYFEAAKGCGGGGRVLQGSLCSGVRLFAQAQEWVSE